MNRQITFGFILCALITASCRKTEYYKPDELRQVEYGAVSDTLTESTILEESGAINGLYYMEPYLILTNQNTESIIQLMDTRSDSIVSSFGHIGHARNEFLFAPKIYNASDGRIYVEDGQNTKVINLYKTLDEGRCVMEKTSGDNPPTSLDGVYMIENGKNLVYHAPSCIDARDGKWTPPFFELDDEDGNTIKQWHIYPDIPETAYDAAKLSLYYNQIYVSPDRTKVLEMLRFNDIINLFDLRSMRCIGVQGDENETFGKMIEVTAKRFAETLTIFNVAACVSDTGIILLRDGRKAGDVSVTPDDNGSSSVAVLDWDGNLLGEYAVPRRLQCIAYDEKSHALYGLGVENGLYRYTLH